MISEDIEKRTLASLPNTPGVYIFKNEAGDVLYVGKAINLKNRVTQYFRNEGDGRQQIPFLMKEAASVEHIVTDSDAESLMLENNLIKRFRPRYNIKLIDDKNYVFIMVDYNCEIPQICTAHNTFIKKAKYFGPYSSGSKVRETLRIMRYIFSYCANKKVGDRPCFYYHLHHCPGVCVGQISLEDYRKNYIHRIEQFLSGNIDAVKKDLQKQMKQFASEKHFEGAAQLRDRLRSLEVIEERQKVVLAKNVNWDFISLFRTFERAVVNVFSVREGKMVDRNSFILEGTKDTSDSQVISAFMENYYLERGENIISNSSTSSASNNIGESNLSDIRPDLPKEIFVQELPSDIDALKIALGGKINISKPVRGKNNQLIKLGSKNAKEFYEQWSTEQASELSRTGIALNELATVLELSGPPQRLECFDISNTQGTNAVASMVVFEKALPKKSEYRKFKMKISGQPNDFEMMREALTRRFRPSEDPEQPRWRYPDLLVIDGGKGQLGVAVEVLQMYGLDIPVIGLAKREEEIFRPGISEALLLPKTNYALQLLQRLRDEAHRFGITFHKSLRSKGAIRSALDDIEGIGPVKKKQLLKKFGSVAKIKTAAIEELAEIVGQKTAEEIRKSL
jgi:excinuclease ABC subunit C